jgi:nucleoid DNA-binding protein
MNRPGAEDMKHVNKLFTKYPFEKLVPFQKIIQDKNPENENHIRAATANDNSFVLVYLAKGQRVNLLNLSQFKHLTKAHWFNPREGKFSTNRKIKNENVLRFTPPSAGIGNDWMLVLE